MKPEKKRVFSIFFPFQHPAISSITAMYLSYEDTWTDIYSWIVTAHFLLLTLAIFIN